MSKTKAAKVTTLADHPAYREANQRLLDLQTHRRGLLEREAELTAIVGDARESAADKIEAEALAMIGNPEAKRKAEQREELADVRQGLRVADRAIELQQAFIARVREEASDQACDALAPAWHETLLEISDLCEQLVDAMRREEQQRRDVRARGFDLRGPFLYDRALYQAPPLEWCLPKTPKLIADFAGRIRNRVEEQNERLAKRS